MSWDGIRRTNIHIERERSAGSNRVDVRRWDIPNGPAGLPSWTADGERIAQLERRAAALTGREDETALAGLAMELLTALDAEGRGLLQDLGEYVCIATDLPYLPWELLPLETDRPVTSALGLSRPLGRILQVPRRGAFLAPVHTTARAVFVVNPTGKSGLLAGLPEAEEQAARIRGMLIRDHLLDEGFRPAGLEPVFAGSDATRERIVEVIDAARDRPVDILHLACHCVPDGGLVLADGEYTPDAIRSQWGGQKRRFPRLVFLNACGSAGRIRAESQRDSVVPSDNLIAAFVEAGASCLLGTTWPVAAGASADLAIEFYRQAILGHSVGRSLQLARDAVRRLQPSVSSWGAFVLYGDPELRLFAKSGRDARHRVEEYLRGGPATTLTIAAAAVPEGLAHADRAESTMLGSEHGPLHVFEGSVTAVYRDPVEALQAARRAQSSFAQSPPGGIALHRAEVFFDGFRGSAFDRLLSEAEQLWRQTPPGRVWASYAFYDVMRASASGHRVGRWERRSTVRLPDAPRIEAFEWSEADSDAESIDFHEETARAPLEEQIRRPAYLEVAPWEPEMASRWWFCLHSSEITIGSAWDNDVVLRDPEGAPCPDGKRRSRVSRRHARLLRYADGWYVEDGHWEGGRLRGSSWGTWVAGRPIGYADHPGRPFRLSSRQVVHIGAADRGPDYRMQLIQPSHELTTPQAESQILPASILSRMSSTSGVTAAGAVLPRDAPPGAERVSEEGQLGHAKAPTEAEMKDALAGPVRPLTMLAYGLAAAMSWCDAPCGAVVGRIGRLQEDAPLLLAGQSRSQISIMMLASELLADLARKRFAEGISFGIIDPPAELRDSSIPAYTVASIAEAKEWRGAVVLGLSRAASASAVEHALASLVAVLARKCTWQ